MDTVPAQNIIAIAYDFDGTLTPKPMQEYTVLHRIGIRGRDFWKDVNRQTQELQGDYIATYMRLLLEYSNRGRLSIRRENLTGMGSDINYFPGVPTFFQRINQFVRDESHNKAKIRHYIISSGNKEIIEGSKLVQARNFFNIFASEYHYDHNGVATFPKVMVNDTLKTQFIFRINKGLEKICDNINQFMPIYERPIPFENILYIGDGLTDVPCMRVVKANGGYSIAVYKAIDRRSIAECKKLLYYGRVNFIAEADYRKQCELDRIVKIVLKRMIETICFQKKVHQQYVRYFRRQHERG